ncbi:mavicyanin-like [Rosa rugosa]|uniref:mavicyanin-like n=1 Tax=Rosa rugosa TaxID=74645 RepID=UPI002B40F4AA|nr:mavicyanin-like [Rosa rugosa]
MGLKNTILLSLFLVALVAKKGLAAQHVVGGSQGWEESTDFNSWASAQKFKVGDQLVFKYTSGLHSVVELPNESAFKNCDLGSALDSKKGGNDVVKLNKAGSRYFACGTLGHCDQGMKVKITTAGSTAASSPASSSSNNDGSSSDASTTTSTTSAASANFNSFALFFAMTAVSAFVLVYVF